MTNISDIPVRVEFTSETSMLLPVLHELVSKLESLITTGASSMLDLRHEPLSLDDIAALKALLSQGEINADFTALGSTNIRETGIAGVWWITHYNEQGKVISEFIEISHCPEMLKTSHEDIKPSLSKLKNRITEFTQRPTPEQIAERLHALGFDTKDISPHDQGG